MYAISDSLLCFLAETRGEMTSEICFSYSRGNSCNIIVESASF